MLVMSPCLLSTSVEVTTSIEWIQCDTNNYDCVTPLKTSFNQSSHKWVNQSVWWKHVHNQASQLPFNHSTMLGLVKLNLVLPTLKLWIKFRDHQTVITFTKILEAYRGKRICIFFKISIKVSAWRCFWLATHKPVSPTVLLSHVQGKVRE